MIANSKILEVIELLEQRRWSQRTISIRTGVSRGSVSFIARKADKLKKMIIDGFEIKPSGPVCRCPDCGYKTQLPCVYCEVKKYMAEHEMKARDTNTKTEPEECEINLHGEYLRRYLELKHWRDNHENPHFVSIPDDWPWRRLKNQAET